MHFNSVEQILAQLEQQPGWEKFRHHRQLLKVWHNTVSQNTAEHTRPLYVSRQVLWVSTNSAARAQELSFQRYALLKRLNQQLPFVLKDIRFSASGLDRVQDLAETKKILFTISQQNQSQENKNNLRNLAFGVNTSDNSSDEKQTSKKAIAAARRWLKIAAQNNKDSPLLLCSICNAPTPTGEIERWNCCYLCIAQKWSRKYKPPAFLDPK